MGLGLSRHCSKGSVRNLLVEVIIHSVNVACIHHCYCLGWDKILFFSDCESLVLLGNASARGNTPPVSSLRIAINFLEVLDLGGVTYDSMPDGYMLNIWMLIPDFSDCMLQPVREALLICFEICPAAIELVFAMAVL